MAHKVDTIFAVDCETSGINFSKKPSHLDHDVTKGYQTVSWGIVASSVKHFKPIDKLYVEIKWDGKSQWASSAEAVHGLSRKHLKSNGLDAEDAVFEIASFFLKYMNNADDPIVLLGHNVGTFDKPFLKKLLYTHDVEFKFAHRTLDTFSFAPTFFKANDSNELFDSLSITREEPHNALSDALAALKVFRLVKLLWDKNIS